jgi:hypothetical protein
MSSCEEFCTAFVRVLCTAFLPKLLQEVGIDISRHNGEAYQMQPIMSFPVTFGHTDEVSGEAASTPSASRSSADRSPTTQRPEDVQAMSNAQLPAASSYRQ